MSIELKIELIGNLKLLFKTGSNTCTLSDLVDNYPAIIQRSKGVVCHELHRDSTKHT